MEECVVLFYEVSCFVFLTRYWGIVTVPGFPRVNRPQTTWGGQILTLNLNYVYYFVLLSLFVIAGYTCHLRQGIPRGGRNILSRYRCRNLPEVLKDPPTPLPHPSKTHNLNFSAKVQIFRAKIEILSAKIQIHGAKIQVFYTNT